LTSLDWLKSLGAKIPDRPKIPESLRGWNIKIGELFRCHAPLGSLLVDCPTGRSVYLYLSKIKTDFHTRASARGLAYHWLLLPALKAARDSREMDPVNYVREQARKAGIDEHLLPEDWKLKKVYNILKGIFGKLPASVGVEIEKDLDGSFLGATNLRPDVIASPPPLPVELKTNFFRRSPLRYYLQLAAYALALEHSYGTAVDYAAILEVTPRDYRAKVVGVDAVLRRRLLELVAQKVKVCASYDVRDPGFPALFYCHRCPLKQSCRREQIEN